MPYGKFKTYEEVATTFEIKLKEQNFVQEKSLNIESILFEYVAKNLTRRVNYISEAAICETIISVILNIVKEKYELAVWSHVSFDVSEQDGLVGVPDYLIAPVSDIGTTYEKPVICIIEAKKDNFIEGWAQVLATMVAAQKFNQNKENPVFGIVTTGDIWKFGQLQNNILTMDTVSYSATENLQKLFNIINWVFDSANQQLAQK